MTSANFNGPADSPTRPMRGPPRLPRQSGPRRQVPVVSIPGFHLRRVVGTGGMGVVYEAHDERLDRTVAVKLLHSGGFADPHGADRFRLEAQVVARLRHPHIVQPFQFGEVDGACYLVMEYVAGPNLHAAAGGKPVDPHLAAGAVRTAAEAVGHAHRAGVVHRDLKPANLLLAGPALPAPVRVTDFGMALLMADHPEISRDGTVAGTPGYMAPEQCLADGAVGPWTDVYALGVVLYELLTGRLPVEAAVPELYLAAVQAARPAPPREVNPRVPADLESVCLKCLAKAPQDRYLTADALADDLGRFLGGLPVTARPLNPVSGVLRAARRRPLVAGLAAALAVTLPAAAGWSLHLARRAERAAADARQAAADTRQAHVQEADARRAAEAAATTARAEAARADRNHWAARNALAEAELVRDLLLDGLLDALNTAGAGAAGRAALRGVAAEIAQRFADRPVARDRLEVLLAQRLRRLGDDAAAEAGLRAVVGRPPLRGNYNQFIAVYELAALLLDGDRANEAADLVQARVGGCEGEYGWGDPTSRNLRMLGCRALLAAGRAGAADALAGRELAAPANAEGNPHVRPAWERLKREATRPPGAAAAGAAAAWAAAP